MLIKLKAVKEGGAASPLINENIKFPKMQVITNEGVNMGVLPRSEALKMAIEADLDLVLIAEQGAEGLPVVKIMNFGKVLYAKKKQLADSKKTQKNIQVKEIKFRPKIGEHDYQTKVNQAVQFLKAGKHLKVTLMFRGREAASLETRGTEIFGKVDDSFEQAGLAKLVKEKDMKSPHMWSRVYYLK